MRKIILLTVSLLFFSPGLIFAQENLKRDTFQELKQATGTAVISLPSLIQESLGMLLARESAAIARMEKMNEFIAKRQEKINLFLKQSKSQLKTTKLDSQKAKITKLIEQLKLEKTKTDDCVKTLFASSDLKQDYPVCRKQIIVTNNILKEILFQEKTLVADLKTYKVGSVTATIKISPTQ